MLKLSLPIPVFLALRYSRSRERSSFTRFISRFVMAGIMLGVMALIIVMSVMNGFERELKTRILGIVPQVTLIDAQQSSLADWQGTAAQMQWPQQVQHVSPFVQSEGLVQGEGQMQAVMLQGIYPEHEPANSVLAAHLLMGRLTDLRPGEYRIFIGRPLAMQLDAHVGDRIRVTAAAGQQHTPIGVMPAQRQFTVAGVFEVGADIDRQLILMHGQDAARLFRFPEGNVSGIRLWLDDAFQARDVANQLERQIQQLQLDDQLLVRDWQERFGQLFAAVRMEKGMMMIMLGLIVAVAAFNAVSALVMLIQDKRSDIAVLQTLGLARSRLYQTLVIQGMYSGVVGITLGAILGVLLTYGLNPILMGLGIDIFMQGQAMPFEVRWGQIVEIVLAALVLTMIATLYPAWRAARIQPAEILRYE